VKFVSSIAAIALLAATAVPAMAEGFTAEGSFAHVNHRDGGEAGVGYRFGVGPIHITPIVGGFLHSDDVDIYGKVEATATLLGIGEIGGGLRADDDDVNPYVTAAFAVAPLISIKGNLGDDYYSAGLAVRF
jgi:hypothetical protein